MPNRSLRAGNRSRRTKTRVPSAALPTSSRASDNGPGDRSSPAARIPTNAEAHRTTVTSAAPPASSASRDPPFGASWLKIRPFRLNPHPNIPLLLQCAWALVHPVAVLPRSSKTRSSERSPALLPGGSPVHCRAPPGRCRRFGPGLTLEEGIGVGVGKRDVPHLRVRPLSQQLQADRSHKAHGGPRGPGAHADAPDPQVPELRHRRRTGPGEHVEGTRNLPYERRDGPRVLDARHEHAVRARPQKRVGPAHRLREAPPGLAHLP